MSLRFYRSISAAVLLVWMAPAAGALGIGLHFASEHHAEYHGVSDSGATADTSAEHRGELAKLIQLATHGHHHEMDAAPHSHDVRVEQMGPALQRPGFVTIDFSTSLISIAGTAEARSLADPLRLHPPPAPLFTILCSLLL